MRPANAIRALKKSPDIKYNSGKEQEELWDGMNSFPFQLVPFSFNLLPPARSAPERSLRHSDPRQRGPTDLHASELTRVAFRRFPAAPRRAGP